MSDYQDPFRQLEGGVPGYPVGALLRDGAGKPLCAWCGQTVGNLGRHIHISHRQTLSEYRAKVGLQPSVSRL